MIRIILNGCNGRMGQVITNLTAGIDDMEVVAGVDVTPRPAGSEAAYPVYACLAECPEEADVLIDFSHRQTLADFLPQAVKRRLPAVVATTGLTPEDIGLLEQASGEIPVFRTFNMSLGINLLQQLSKDAVKVLGDRFDVEILEKHHKLKKDSPSGTALMLAESINEAKSEKLRYIHGREGADALRQPGELGIHAVRGGTIVGEHDVLFAGPDEVIQLGHRAYSRQIFANGALTAARFLAGRKPGLYNMQDMITEFSAVTTLGTFTDDILISLDNFPWDMDAIASLYGDLAEADCFIDMISHSGAKGARMAISFTTKKGDLEEAQTVLERLKKTYPDVIVDIEEDIAKLIVEGPGMEFQTGVAGRVFSVMAKAGAAIMAVTTSEVKISCIIASGDVEKAVSVLKQEFALKDA